MARERWNDRRRGGPAMSATVAIAALAWPGILLGDDGGAGTSTAIDGGSPILLWVPIVSYLLTPLVLLGLWRTRGWRPPPAGSPTPWRVPAGPSFAFFALAMVGGAILAGLVAQWSATRWPDDRLLRIAVGTWGGVLGGLLGAAPALAIAVQESRPAGSPPPSRFAAGSVIGAIGLIVALPLVEAVASIGQTIQQAISGREPDPLAHDTLQLLMSHPTDAGWWLVAGGAVIGAPLLEEVLYRGLLQQGMRRLAVSPWIAIFATSALFALMHLPAIPADGRISAIAGLLVLSVGLGVIRERTGRLSPCIIAHGLFNAFNLLLATATAV